MSPTQEAQTPARDSPWPLFGPAELFLDQIVVAPAGRRDELELERGLADIDDIVPDHDPTALPVEGQIDVFPAGQEPDPDGRGRRHGQGAEGQGVRADGRQEDGRHLGVAVSYTHLRAHETDSYLVCRLLLEKKKT